MDDQAALAVAVPSVTAAARREAASAILGAVTVSLTFGVSYAGAGSNQHTYLLEGLRRLDPSFVSADWLLNETYAYHPLFSWVVVFAGKLGSVGWGLALINTVITASVLVLLYRLLCELAPRHSVGCFLLICFFIVVERTNSVSFTSIFTPHLLPATIAGVALLVAVVLFVRGSWAMSGLALAFSGAFHVNYLVVGLALFAVAHLLLGREGGVWRVVKQLAPGGLILALKLPVLIEAGMSQNSAAARYVIQIVRAPHHYLPSAFRPDLVRFVAWHLLALASLPGFSVAKRLRTRFLSLYAAGVGMLGFAMLLTGIFYFPVVAQLYLWRVAPFTILAAQVVIVCGTVALLAGSNGGDAVRYHSGYVMLGSCAALLLMISQLLIGVSAKWQLLYAAFWIGLAGAVVGRKLVPPQDHAKTVRRHLPVAFGTIFFCAAVLLQMPATIQHSTLLRSDVPPDEAALYRWARTTPESAVFLIPPQLASFRVHGERAVVVDWKSTPMLPDEVMEWFRRIELISGGRPVTGYQDAVEGYRSMTDEWLEKLEREFNFDYAVLPEGSGISGRWPTLYRNERFMIVGNRSVASPAVSRG